MDDFNFRRRRVPAFGSWDCHDSLDLPFTQCFDSATQPGLIRCSYSEDRDLYVAGDLYENDVVTPAMIVVPRHRGKVGYSKHKEREKEEWGVVCNCEFDLKTPPSLVSASVTPSRAKAVDQDLYKISPELIRARAKRRRLWGHMLRCLRPACFC